MRLHLVIALFFFSLARPSAMAAPEAVQGSVDLRRVDWKQESIIKLNGEWRFYWNQLLSPTELESGQGHLSAYVPPQAEWHVVSLPNIDLGRIGGATYHLELQFDEAKELVLAVPVLNSASKVWINGELKQEFGRVSLKAAEEEAHVRHSRLPFIGRKGKNSITVQVTNHSFWFGGASWPLRLGLAEAFHREQLEAVLKDALSFGFILFMSLYHIYIRVLLKRSNGALLFGLFGLGVSLRMAMIGSGRILYLIWPEIPQETRYFVEYIGVASSVALLMGFYRELYPKESPNWLYLPGIYASVAWTVFIILAPARYYPAPLELFQLVMLLSGISSIYTLTRAIRNGRDGARLLFAANGIAYMALANDVILSHRLIPTIPLIHYGLMVMLFCLAIMLAQRFAHSFDRAEKAEQEVSKLNQSLEQKIVERTEQINTILSHVRSGFLLVDREARLLNGYTSSCEAILGKPLKEGERLTRQLGFSARIEMQFVLAIQQIFDSDLPTEVAMQQLPPRFAVSGRMVGLQAAAVKAKDSERVTAVLFTLNDVTDLVAAEEGLRHADVLIHILEDQDAFRIFLADFKKDLESASRAIIQGDAAALHSILHTMKGNAASFNLEDWVERLHQLEEQAGISEKDILDLVEHVRDFLKQNEGILHLDFEQPMRSIFGIDQSDLNALKESLAPVAPPIAIARVETWSRSVKALPLKSYTTPLGPMVKRVARQLQKNVQLLIEGADMKVDNSYGRLLTTLPHLVRNALVHGIEEPEERGSKPPQATISLRFATESDGGLRMEIADDGRGLDIDRIRRHALEEGLIKDAAGHSDEEAMDLIFHPNFSTAEKVNDLAGRGMGLAAVASAVHELGGRYEIKNRKGHGLHLTVIVPTQSPAHLDRAS